jgi:uncharacterized membrane protein
MQVGLISCNYSYEKKSGVPGMAELDPLVRKSSRKMSSVSDSNGVYDQIVGLKCMSCHNSTNAQGGTNLDSIDEVRRLTERIRYRAISKKDMPPNERLTSLELETLQRWLEQGTPESANGDDWQPSVVASFDEIKFRIFEKSCFPCHSGAHPEGNLDLENYEQVRATIKGIVSAAIVDEVMPLAPFEKLSNKQKKLLSDWFIEGTPQ